MNEIVWERKTGAFSRQSLGKFSGLLDTLATSRIGRIDAGWSIRKIRKIREGRILSADSRRFPQIIWDKYDGEEMSTENTENTENMENMEKERSAKNE